MPACSDAGAYTPRLVSETEPPSDRPAQSTGPRGVTRTELVWPGKYDDQGRLNTPPRVRLPFQTIETVGESRAGREARKRRPASLFEVWRGQEGDTFEDGWKNKLIWGDNLLVMQSLLDEFAGKIDLIYIDPPFATGADFSFKAPVGDGDAVATKQQSILEEKAYRDTWRRGRGSWMHMMHARLGLFRDLLSDSRTIYIHLDWYLGHHLRPVLDEVFGEESSLGEIVWGYGSPSGGRVSGSKLVKAHDTIYAFAKRYGQHKYKPAYLPYSEKYIKDWFRYTDEKGRRYRKRQRIRKGTGERYWERQYLDDSKGVPASTVWTDIQQAYADPRAYKLGARSEITGYATQKPERLLDRVIQMSSDPNDLVADFFCGSGTTLAVAEKLGRRWIGCDLGRWAVHLTRKRLLDIENCRPFTLLNLGKYERQHWQGVTFGPGSRRSVSTQAYYEYLAFILDLYGAVPVPGMEFLHGRKGRALVHVGPVDAPVTIGDIENALGECARAGQKELHILAWEWEMGLAGATDANGGGLIHRVAKRLGVRLRLLRIPREVMEQQAADKGDVQFFELAYLEAKIEQGERRRERRVRLTDFVVPNPDSVPAEVRASIGKWSDWVDYWAVDWDFRHDAFTQGFVAYRTRKQRKLDLVSDPHRYEEPGRYRVLVKAVDIFGNDTSRAFDLEVR